jgi:hypothetical protein
MVTSESCAAENPVEHIRFLGICRRAAVREDALDLIGFTNVFHSQFFPMRFGELFYVLGVDRSWLTNANAFQADIQFVEKTAPTNRCTATMTLGGLARPSEGRVLTGSPVLDVGQPTTFIYPYYSLGDGANADSLVLLALPAPDMILLRPTRVDVFLATSATQTQIGAVDLLFRAPAPLTDEERRAIASRAESVGVVEMGLTCKKCGDSVHFFAVLDPTKRIPWRVAERGSPLESAPEYWTCKCGMLVAPLEYAKRGLAAIFRTPVAGSSEGVELSPLFDAGEVGRIAEEYATFVEALPSEEAAQDYIEKRPLIWHFLAPTRIFHKPLLLGSYKADFGIMTAGGELVLVELEKPSTQLLTGSGRVAAEVQAGADQIRDWDLLIADHRGAVLEQLKLDADAVHNIRYLLVAGLATTVTRKELRKLRSEPLVPKTDLLCFDELGSYLRALAFGLRTL